MTIGSILLVIAVFLLINALYVAAEFALVGAPRTAIEHRAGQGDRMSQRLARLMDSSHEQDRYIATAQIGITVASLGLGMFGEHGLADWFAPRLRWFGDFRFVTAHFSVMHLDPFMNNFTPSRLQSLQDGPVFLAIKLSFASADGIRYGV